MYDIALSVAACVRSGTRADVAWMVAPTVSDEALAFTPGGGRIGGLANGAFDGLLADVAARQLSTGRHVAHTVTALESQVSGIPEGTPVEFLVVPAEQIDPRAWPLLLEREALAVTAALDGDEVTTVSITAEEDTSGAERDAISAGQCLAVRDDRGITAVITPVSRLVVAGQGPIAEALAAQANLLGWKAAVDPRPAMVAGLTASLSPMDAVVVMGHDVEASSTCLMAALDSDAGYIGALGSKAMQQSRADWLALRDVTDLSRVNGPAGLDIGAGGPAEIAVSIAAQIIAARRLP